MPSWPGLNKRACLSKGHSFARMRRRKGTHQIVEFLCFRSEPFPSPDRETACTDGRGNVDICRS